MRSQLLHASLLSLAYLSDRDSSSSLWLKQVVYVGPGVQVMLRVTDLDRSIKWYTEALGCTLIRTRDNPDNKYKLAFLGNAFKLPTACNQRKVQINYQ